MDKKIGDILKVCMLLLMIIFLFVPTISENLFVEQRYGAYVAADGRWSSGKSIYEENYSLIGLHENMNQGIFAIIMLIVLGGGLVWYLMRLFSIIKKNPVWMTIGYPIVLLVLSCCSCFGVSHSDVMTYGGVDYFVQRVSGAAPTILFCLVAGYAIISLIGYWRAKKENPAIVDEVTVDLPLDVDEQE